MDALENYWDRCSLCLFARSEFPNWVASLKARNRRDPVPDVRNAGRAHLGPCHVYFPAPWPDPMAHLCCQPPCAHALGSWRIVQGPVIALLSQKRCALGWWLFLAGISQVWKRATLLRENMASPAASGGHWAKPSLNGASSRVSAHFVTHNCLCFTGYRGRQWLKCPPLLAGL